MTSSCNKGNNPERWKALLVHVDEKLQLGLLDHLEKIASYHFEEDILYIQPGSKEDKEYLSRNTVFQQLELLAEDAVGVSSIKIQ